MKLRLISEIQLKMPTTNMDRANVSGQYAVTSMNDVYHLMHDGDGHSQKRKKKKVKKARNR